jgi:RHS repeat-associated protein
VQVSLATGSATDGGGTTKTNLYRTVTNGIPANQSLTFDLNGNMTSDGTNTYQWDAENRLIQVNYPGTGNYTEFVYDGLDACATIVEYTAGALSETRQFISCGSDIAEFRDANSNVKAQYFWFGASIAGSPYFYSKDYLGSIVALSGGTGAVEAEYFYNPFGSSLKNFGTASSDFQFAGYYLHQRSGLNMTLYRFYNPKTGSWLSRDQLDQSKLYEYAKNNPVNFIDRLGLLASMPGAVLAAGPGGKPGGKKGGGGNCPPPPPPPPGGPSGKDPFIQHSNNQDCQWMWDEILRLMLALQYRNYQLEQDFQNLFISAYSKDVAKLYGNYMGHELAAHEAKSSLAQLVRLAQQDNCPIPPGASWLLNTPIPVAPSWVVKAIPNWRQVFKP